MASTMASQHKKDAGHTGASMSVEVTPCFRSKPTELL